MLLISVVLVCLMGKYPLSVNDIFNIIKGEASVLDKAVFFKIRLPRVFFCAIAGAVIAVCGNAYRELFGNPLASPDVLGASSGAGVGTAIALILGMTSFRVQAMGLVFSIIAVIMTVALCSLMGRAKATYLVLSGIVIKALCDSAIMVFKYMSESQGKLAALEYRLMGSFQNVRNIHIIQILPVCAVCLLLLYLLRWRIRILSLGDDEAIALGMNAGRLRVVCIILATLPVAATVSVTGVISWAGLIVPHAVSFLCPGDFKDNFLTCVVAGAVFMIWTDTAARTITSTEIPISILTSFMGAVLLGAFLIYRKRRGKEDE